MLRRINIENFQSHEKTSLVLSPGINVIIGPSDSGKTSIIRALRWLAQNRPAGTALRSSWGGDTRVEVELGNGVLIRRERTKQDNSYSLGEEVYKSFGMDPPEDIQQALAFQSVNLQQQLDRPFLLDETPGQVAQYLNSVAHLDIIDQATSRINSWMRSIDGEVRHNSQQQEDLTNSLGEYNYLEAMEKEITALEAGEKEAQISRQKVKDLHGLILSLREVEQKLQVVAPLLSLKEDVNKALQLRTTRASLGELKQNLQQVEARARKIAPLQALREGVEEAIQMYEKRKALRQHISGMVGVIQHLCSLEEQVETAQAKLEGLRDRFEKGMGDQCPLCGAKRHR